MSFSCNTDSFPSLSSYADARKHFDSVKPYRGYTLSDPRPIGVRSHKHKNMRLLSDGSIAFRLFQTDCVVWHPDNRLTIEGYDTMSTSAFVDSLVPDGVRHAKGRSNDFEPVLQLYPPNERYWLPSPVMGDYRYSDQWVRNPEYGKHTQIIRCDQGVTLQCRANRWQPVDERELRPFRVPTIDRKAAREVSREYHLPMLTKVLNAVVALTQLPAGARSTVGAGIGRIRRHHGCAQARTLQGSDRPDAARNEQFVRQDLRLTQRYPARLPEAAARPHLRSRGCDHPHRAAHPDAGAVQALRGRQQQVRLMPELLTKTIDRALEVGDVLLINREVKPKEGKPFVWRFFMVATHHDGWDLSGYVVGATGKLKDRPLDLDFDDSRNVSIHYLPMEEWPNGVHQFRMALIMQRKIDI